MYLYIDINVYKYNNKCVFTQHMFTNTYLATSEYIYIYLHTYIHTYIYTYMYTYIYTYMYTYILTYILTYIQLHTNKHTYLLAYITWRYIRLHYLTLHHITSHTLHLYHYITLHYITLQYITIHTYITHITYITYIPIVTPCQFTLEVRVLDFIEEPRFQPWKWRWRKFQYRKPIGEVGCCESRMAERIHWLTERWLELCLLEWLQWLRGHLTHNCWM